MKRINRHGIVAANISYKSYNENLEYFCIEALEDGLTAKLSVNACEYSLDGNTWNSLSAATNTPAINTGDKIYFRGNLIPTSGKGIGTFTISKKCNVKGNVMSLLYGDDFEGKTDLTGKNYAFYKLFYNCTKIVDASELILPATILANRCYNSMFQGCTGLTSAPVLPATKLTSECYSYMFYGCTSLTTPPELPATTLADSCYSFMFYGTNVLPDCNNIDFTNETVVAIGGLIGLFAGTKVTDADLNRILPKNNNGKYCLPVITLANDCYSSMFYGCTGLTTAPVLPATTLANDCYSSMFYGCTGLTTAPELPATTLAYGCYSHMFTGCTSLEQAPALPATTLASYCYQSMFRGCSKLTTAAELPATTLADNCYYYMFQGCTGLTTAPELPATTLVYSCYDSMFYGCTGLTTAPELPATTLANSCYYNMFYNCSKLNYIKMLATDISATRCLADWLYRVSSTGTFVKHPDMTSLPSGSSGIPKGWTVEYYAENSPNLITFIINNLEYQAEEGMTWEEWVNSGYNTCDAYILSNGKINLYNINFEYIYNSTNNEYNGVYTTDIIQNNHRYNGYGGFGGD